MRDRLADFCLDDTGAVTVDWVVLTAAIVGLSMIVVIPFAYSANNATQNTADLILSIPVGIGN